MSCWCPVSMRVSMARAMRPAASGGARSRWQWCGGRGGIRCVSMCEHVPGELRSDLPAMFVLYCAVAVPGLRDACI